MLQSGMRAPMGIKVKGQDLEQIDVFGLQLESALKIGRGGKDLFGICRSYSGQALPAHRHRSGALGAVRVAHRRRAASD
jgi:Putative silver efflux pump